MNFFPKTLSLSTYVLYLDFIFKNTCTIQSTYAYVHPHLHMSHTYGSLSTYVHVRQLVHVRVHTYRLCQIIACMSNPVSHVVLTELFILCYEIYFGCIGSIKGNGFNSLLLPLLGLYSFCVWPPACPQCP